MKYLILFSLLITSYLSTSQTLKARVVDEKNEPLMGAEVYFDRTTRGVLTDMDGYFKIDLPPNLSNPTLVISYLGYNTLSIKDIYELEDIYKLTPKFENLDKSSIYTNVFTRKQMERVFKKYFLGKGNAANQSEILNLDDVVLYYVSDENTLYAESFSPIEIENKYLGYHIKFDLTNFEVNYRAKTLSDRFLKRTFYEGTTYFEDKNPNKKDHRKIVYRSSLTNFFKNLIDSTLQLTPYKIAYRGFIKDPNDVFTVDIPLDPEANFCVVRINPDYINLVDGKYTNTKFTLMYKSQRTTLMITKPSFKVDRRGNLIDIVDVILGDGLANNRVAKLLPVDYQPTQ